MTEQWRDNGPSKVQSALAEKSPFSPSWLSDALKAYIEAKCCYHARVAICFNQQLRWPGLGRAATKATATKQPRQCRQRAWAN